MTQHAPNASPPAAADRPHDPADDAPGARLLWGVAVMWIMPIVVGIALLGSGGQDRTRIAPVGEVPAVAAPAEAANASPSDAGAATPQVAVRSGRLEDLDLGAAPRPVSVRIEAIGVEADTVPVGVTDTGDLEVPGAADVGWYEFGPAPGAEGSAVLAAHVDLAGRPGAFFRLGDVRPGDVVTVGFDDGTERRFEITGLRQYGKQVLPSDDLFRRDGAAALALITCGGEFDETERSYEDNLVAYAVPVASADWSSA